MAVKLILKSSCLKRSISVFPLLMRSIRFIAQLFPVLTTLMRKQRLYLSVAKLPNA